MRLSPQARFILGASAALCLAGSSPCPAQQPATPQASGQQPPQAKKPVAGPAAPQSTHYPILLLAQGLMPGTQQNSAPVADTASAPTDSASTEAQAPDIIWSLRIGQKGPERLDRVGYPPIPLEPADVVREGTADTWTYHGKDIQTGAAVSVHITREPCTPPGATTTKLTFTASVDHAQIGAMQGCARVAAELFPKINNQPTDDDDDAKNKPAPPTITNFKPPVAVAYIAGGRMYVKRRITAKAVPGKTGYNLGLSRDGKKLLFTRDEQPAPMRSINEYSFELGSIVELLEANAYATFWSPDESRIAFLRNVEGKWHVWAMPADSPEKAALFYPREVLSLHGWADEHTVLGGDLQTLSWIGDDGTVKQTLLSDDLYGQGQFGLSSGNTVRIHPVNPDLLLVSAEWLNPPQGSPKDPGTGRGQTFFLYEIRSKRRVLLGPPNMFSGEAEWSKDGLQIFFTGRDTVSGPTTIYKMFWDGTSLLKVQDGRNFVIGQ